MNNQLFQLAKKMSSETSLHRLLDRDGWKLEDVQRFLEKDSSSINEKDSFGDSPLHVVLRNKNCSSDVVQLLLKYGADVNAVKIWNLSSPLLIALEKSRDDAVVMTLIENGANINVFGGFGLSCLCIALRYRASINVIQLLLNAGCSLNDCMDTDHGSVLHCATFATQSVLNSDVPKMIIKRGADINAVNSQGQSVLCSALKNGNEGRFIQLLLEAGVSVNGCRNHASLLICAMKYRQGSYLKKSVVQMLLEAGASMNQVDTYGFTALQCALRYCVYETNAIALLLDYHKGMDLNSLVDYQDNSLLHLAVLNPNSTNLSVVKLLVQRGLNVDKVNIKGDTPLKYVIESPKCQPSIVKLLLKEGATVNAKIVEIAVERFYDVKIIKLLFAASAPISCSSFHSLLKKVLDRPIRRVCFRFLFLVYFLQDHSIPFLNYDHLYYQKVQKFRNQCVPELLKMKSKIVGHGYTLHDFLSGCRSPPLHESGEEAEEEMYDLDRLLVVIASDVFPLYFEIIADKVGRPQMTAKLEEWRLFVPKYSPTYAFEKNIVLPYECTLKISDFLEEKDLLSFLVAMSNVEASNGQSKKRKRKKRKSKNRKSKKRKILEQF